MKILFTGGGTAGHVTPAIAIAEKIKRLSKNCEIYFIGRSGGAENALIRNAGYPIFEIKVRGLSRKHLTKNISVLREAVKARKAAKEILLSYAPDVVVGTGGYVSWPAVSAANSLGIPTVLHESNAALGASVRMLARRADKLLLGTDIKTKYKIPIVKRITSRLTMRSNLAFISY